MHFVVGVTNENVNIKPEFYDLFLNLASNKVLVSPQAKGWYVLIISEMYMHFGCRKLNGDKFSSGYSKFFC